MRSVSSKTVDLARLKSSETFIEIEEEKKKKRSKLRSTILLER